MKSSPKKRKTREESVKLSVWKTFFLDEGFDIDVLGNIDFTVGPLSNKDLEPKDEDDRESLEFFLWAEAKRGKKKSILESFVQLIFTIGKERVDEDYSPPHYLGAFDEKKIAFVDYDSVMEVEFNRSNFNWKPKPSNHNSPEFKQLLEVYSDTLKNKMEVFDFEDEDSVKELHHFIKDNFRAGASGTRKRKVRMRNLLYVFRIWKNQVGKKLFDWADVEQNYGVSDADFYLADLISRKNFTFKDNLSVKLGSDARGIYYDISQQEDVNGRFGEGFWRIRPKEESSKMAHRMFWERYERPPEEEYLGTILERRDILLSQKDRERKGAYFTPPQWVKLSQEYIARELGENWQDEYYVWDCCAGTGNLLAGLKDEYKVFASTLDVGDVRVMRERIRSKDLKLLDDNVFKFNFLNGEFKDIPNENLRKILLDPERRKKLVIYINPPYVEAGNSRKATGTGEHKTNVATKNATYDKYNEEMGEVSNELYAQFLFRIYKELRGVIIANFSTLKILQTQDSTIFRGRFKAKLCSLFIVPAYTFDNVKGEFPIGFHVWRTAAEEKPFEQITADVYVCGEGNDGVKLIEKKQIYSPPRLSLNEWMADFRKIKRRTKKTASKIKSDWLLLSDTADFQHQNHIYFCDKKNKGNWAVFDVDVDNFTPSCVCLAVRLAVEADWLNNRDQFFYPYETWREDLDFQGDCIVYALFHMQNRISSLGDGTPPWIPFDEKEVHPHKSFSESSLFISNFLKGKFPALIVDAGKSFYKGTSPVKLSKAAHDVYEAGREIWEYYHSKPDAKMDASFFDIRWYFQKNEDETRMDTSRDEYYRKLTSELRRRLKILAKKIEPKVYEHGFLLK